MPLNRRAVLRPRTSRGPLVWTALAAWVVAAPWTAWADLTCPAPTYNVVSVGSSSVCYSPQQGKQLDSCCLTQTFSCLGGAPTGGPSCVFEGCIGAACPPSDGSTTACPGHGQAELCGGGSGNAIDDNYNGCIDEGCLKGHGSCSCVARCSQPSCTSPQVATCDPFSPSAREICFNHGDDNCNGRQDEGCNPKASCGGNAGKDPISISIRAAVSEPFTDFSVETLTQLAITRTYASADTSIHGGAHGVFGRGWRHDWEAELTCDGDYCSVLRANRSGYAFRKTGTALSLDATETWDIYRRGDTEVVAAEDGHQLLVRRPTGTWILFMADGSEMHFATACDACAGGSDSTCVDPLLSGGGGRARLVDFFDPKGTRIHFSYDRPGGVLLSLSDALGHRLELESATACTDGLARDLRYDGQVVATYAYDGTDLIRAGDAGGTPFRSYAYLPDGYLRAVLNEGGAAIAEFSYDANGDAIGVIDGASDVAVQYGTDGAVTVTERFGNGSAAASQRQLDRNGNVSSISDGCACGPPVTRQWSNGNLVCELDAQGRATTRRYDDSGRMTYTASFVGTCGLPSSARMVGPEGTSPPATPSDETWRTYGLVKQIARNVSLPLSHVKQVKRVGVQSGITTETLEYEPSPLSVDPSYSCTVQPATGEPALPVGAVVCRKVSYGIAQADGVLVREKTATYYSYDAKGRLARTIGPLFVERINASYQNVPPPANDLVPTEERSYWPDTETLARRGRLHEVRRYSAPGAAPLVTAIDYDAFGPFSVTEPDGTVTLFIKDGRGRTISTVRAGVASEVRYYDGTLPRLVLAASGAATRTTYDVRGRATVVEHLDRDPEASGPPAVVLWSEHTSYDEAGNPVHRELRDGTGAVTWVDDRMYDVQHRLLAQSHPEQPAKRKSWTFDPAGFLTDVLDEEGRRTTFRLDPLGRVASVVRSGLNALGALEQVQLASYAYEASDVSVVVDENGRPTSYLRTDAGAVSRVTTRNLNGFGDAVDYEYDARSNPVRRKSHTNGYLVTSSAYDALDRPRTVTARDNYDNQQIAYEFRYDENGFGGKLTSVVEPERTVTYTYDASGLLSTEKVDEGGVASPLITSYDHDASGQISRLGYPSGLSIAFERDSTGEVRRIRTADGATVLADGIVRWPTGPVKAFTFGSGEAYAFTVNRRYEPAAVRSGPLALDYSVNAAGDVTAMQEGGATTAYSYDVRDRLVGVSPGAGASVAVEYGRGPLGSTDRLLRAGTFNGATLVSGQKFDHDFQANVSAIGRVVNNSVTAALCLRHDALSRLVIVGTTPTVYGDQLVCVRNAEIMAVKARFKYDARNRRIARWLAATGEWTYFIHSPSGELLSELRLSGGTWVPVRDYVWLDGRPLAQIEYGASGERRVYYVHADHLGMPRKLTSPEGAVVWSATTRPYGEVTEATTPDPITGKVIVTNLRLPGQYDERLFAAAGLSGLQGPYYNWNRWYLPSVGRYMELDPIALRGKFNGSFGPDWYNYADGNPLGVMDPTGRASCYYSIGSGLLTCVPDDPVHQGVSIHVASGNNGNGMQCKNNSACTPLVSRGPIPTGKWCWNVNGPGSGNTKPNGRRLVPQPGTNYYGRDPGTFLTHSCLNPFGPSTNAPYCSEGCVTGTAPDIKRLNDLIDVEPDSCMWVSP